MNLIEQLQAEESARLASIELDESPSLPPRFDLPVKLEDRGITPEPGQAKLAQSLEWYQQLIWAKGTIHKNTIAAKLRSVGRRELAETLEGCHTMFTVAQ